jgi:WD40 repeat protein/serine/threonine protein kinase
MNGRKDRVEAIFQAAMELNSPQEREAYLLRECGEDAELRREVEELLRAAVDAEGVFESRPHEPALEQAGSRIGHYHLLQKIGEGGCGVVYMAEQEAPVRRKVALKIVKLGMDTRQVVARFEAERQALALMDHPNIAKVLDAGATETARPYFVMELVRGTRITNYCDEQKLSMEQRLNLFIQVCQAVQHAHQKGVVHRDLKPSNILVTERDGVPVPKVIDFGIAKATGDLQLTNKTLFTAFEQFLGTPAYMSPEQARLGELDIDTRSDIYSLGVLLYELLTGQPPFEAAELKRLGIDEVLKTVREQDPPLPSNRLTAMTEAQRTTMARCRQVDPSVLPKILSGDLDWIVMKCLEKDRTRRYETANGLALDVQHFLKHEPVTAAAPSAGYRMRKFVQRNRAPVITAGTIAVLLITGITASIWLALVANHAKNWANIARDNEANANRQLKQQVSEAEEARRAERRERLRAEEALEQAQMAKAEDLFTGGSASLAVAHLGRVLRSNPSNQVAATRLVSALVHRRFPVVTAGPIGGDEVVSAQLSPDGHRVVTASKDSAAWLWDASTGQPVARPLRHQDVVRYMAFTPDGQRVVTASRDKTARVWDARTGQPLTDPLRHENSVVFAEFGPDGQRVVTASDDKTARVWDARTGQPLTDPLRHEAPVYFAQFSPDGRLVVTDAADNTFRTWDVITGQPLSKPLRHEEVLRARALPRFSPDSGRILTASFSRTQVWDARSGRLISDLLMPGAMNSAEFSPDGIRMVAASPNYTARLWNTYTGKPLTEALPIDSIVNRVRFSRDGQRVVTASADHTARVWDARSGRPLTEPLQHVTEVISAELSDDGQRILTASWDGKTRFWWVWDAHTGQAFSDVLAPERGATFRALSHDGYLLASARGVLSEPCYVQVWDARTWQPVGEPLRHEHAAWPADFSPDGQRLVTIEDGREGNDGWVRVWDISASKVLTETALRQAWLISAKFSPDAQRLVTTWRDINNQEVGYARVWDVRTGRPVTDQLRHRAAVVSAQFSPDGQRLVTASEDKTARVWDARTGQALGEPLRHQERVMSAEFSPEGEWVVTASSDQTARVWDARTGQPITEPLRHAGQVWVAHFSPDGKRVVTASEDHTARIWDAHTGEPLTEPLRHDGKVSFAQFSPDGEWVVTSRSEWGKSGYAQVWDVRTGQAVTERLRPEGDAPSAKFNLAGQRVTTCSAPPQTFEVWEVPKAPVPVPEWFVEWAEAVAGCRLNREGIDVVVPPREVLRQTARAVAREETDFFTRLAKWFQADPSARTISPFSLLTAADYVNHRVQQNTLSSLREATQLSPTNILAFARLAALFEEEEPEGNPDRLREAEFFARYALKLDPENHEAKRILVEIQKRKSQ